MKLISAGIIATVALFGYVALTATFAPATGIPKVNNPLGLTQWELDNIGNPEVQQHIEIIEKRRNYRP